MNIIYPAKISYQRNSQNYFVKFYDFEEAITEGKTLEEAILHAAEVLTLTLEGRMDENLPIPHSVPSKRKNAYWIAPSARVQAALLLRFSKGTRTTALLARQLNSSWPAMARLENPHHWPSLRQLERAASALDKRLVLSLEPICQQLDPA